MELYVMIFYIVIIVVALGMALYYNWQGTRPISKKDANDLS